MSNGLSETIERTRKLVQKSRLTETERILAAALKKNPTNFHALHRLGFLRYQQDRHADALKLIGRALKLNPKAADALSHYGMILRKLNRHEEALAFYDKALAIKPDYADALNNRGNLLLQLERHEEALASLNKALDIRPRYPEALNNRGNVLMELNRFEDALASYDQALKLEPNYVNALRNRGNALLELRHFDDAFEFLGRALVMRPHDPELLFSCGRALQESKEHHKAVVAFDKALEIEPRNAKALYHRGQALMVLQRIAEASADFRRLLAIQPDHPSGFTSLLSCYAQSCDWVQVARMTRDLERRLDDRRFIIQPFQLLSVPSTPAQQLKCAKTSIRSQTWGIQVPDWSPVARKSDKIRVGYFSADFRTHVVATVVAELFELHDRARFGIVGISFGPDDKTELRSRIIESFDEFHDVRSSSDREIANLMHELAIDIAVDLTGHTSESRIRALAYRPCPIQVSYLGYPGTTGASFIDYIIADQAVAPLEHEPFFAEKIVHLPDSYLPNDSRYLKIAPNVPSRTELGLPEQGFVLCAFNNYYKITAPVFDIWMRTLRTIDCSVLWLTKANNVAMDNLKREAAARGVDPQRLIFAPRADPMENHLARHRQADLYVDTLPYNAHSTAANALWAGLPVLTCKGDAFAGRVAASLLHAVGLPELVTNSLEEYEGLVLKLATDSDLLQSLRRRLEVNRLDHPLFDQQRLCRHIEAAYTTMWDIHQRGEAPRSFRVDPEPSAVDEIASSLACRALTS
jgi:protein O-GlcNAc transferase